MFLEEEAGNPATSTQRLETLSADPRLRLVVAGNPAAPAMLLALMALDQDIQVRHAVACNPNTPWQVLEALAREFPHAFFHNPVGPFQLIAHPEQVSIDETFWRALLREVSIPAVWWNWLKSHPTLSANPAIRLHIQFAGETIFPAGISQEKNEQTLLILVDMLTAACTPNTSRPEIMSNTIANQPAISYEQIIGECLQRLAHSTDSMIRQAVAKNPQTPVEVLQVLACDPEVPVRQDIASHARTPVETLQILACDPGVPVRQDIANHSRTPIKVLQILARDPDVKVRRWVASHPQMPVKPLQILALDIDTAVRSIAARHPQMPVEILQILAPDASEGVRSSVAGHRKIPVEMLETLALDTDVSVRKAVAGNRRTPVRLLETLALDKNAYVREEVARNLHTPGELLKILCRDPDTSVRRSVVWHPLVPVKILRTLACDHVGWIRQVVASHPRTPGEVLQTLALDMKDAYVRRSVARNEQAPTEVLELLTRDEDEEVRWAAILAKKLLLLDLQRLGKKEWETLSAYYDEDGAPLAIEEAPIKEQLDMVAQLNTSEQVRQTVLATLAADWKPTDVETTFAELEIDRDETLRTRRIHYQHILAPFLTPLALQKLAASSHWEMRCLVALHSQTPQDIRQCLSQDSNRYVRAVAQAYMRLH